VLEQLELANFRPKYQFVVGNTQSEGHSVGVMWRDASWVSLIAAGRGWKAGDGKRIFLAMEAFIKIALLARPGSSHLRRYSG
jgi:hypothetical protein